ncbi:hypothetical protein ACFL1I_01270 [Candidatus Omnitrophota bacterium]
MANFNYKKHFPWSFVAAIMIFFLTQGTLAKLPAFWQTFYKYSEPIMGRMFRLEAKLYFMPDKKSADKRVIILGGSTVAQGYDTKYLNTEFLAKGVRFYTIDIPFGNPVQLFLLKDRIVKEKPDVVILMPDVGGFYISEHGLFSLGRFFPYTVTWDLIFDPDIVPYLIKHLGVKEVFRERAVFLDGIVNKVVFPRRHRFVLTGILEKMVNAALTGKKPDFQEYYFTTGCSPDFYEKTEKRFRSENKRSFEQSKLTPLCKELFVELVLYFQRNNIKVIVVDSPMNQEINSLYDNKLNTLYNDFLLEQANQLDLVYVSLDELPSFDKDNDYIDYDHLNAQGREKMSKFLQQYIESDFENFFKY